MDLLKFLRPPTVVRFRVVICTAVLFIGILAMFMLSSLKKPPPKAMIKEVPLNVTTISTKPENFTVTIKGYGEVKVLKVVHISPEVSGKITSIHPRLEPGEIIPHGEILFEIDSRDYRSACQAGKANVLQLSHSILRLKKKYQFDRELFKILMKNQELAKGHYNRLLRLFNEHQIGTKSNLDKSEQAWNLAQHKARELAHKIELYPVEIKEAQNRLASEKAKLSMAETDLSRCKIVAPFTARIKNVSLEVDQFVLQGRPVITLADDSILEIHVPIDSMDARKWLCFTDGQDQNRSTWFKNLRKVSCLIQWTGDIKDNTTKGVLHRVVKLDPQTRTLTVAVRIDNKNRKNDQPVLPLVEGMFCKVSIPGRTLSNVYKIPRYSVSFENTVYLSKDNRLTTIPVNVAKLEDEYALVSGGINPGDKVITTRLINPLENTLLVTKGSDGQITKKPR